METNTKRDVNAEFAASKAQQIEVANNPRAAIAKMLGDAEIKDLGNGRYQVLTGWDRGEIFTLSTSGDIRGAHGLDRMENGKVAFYGRKPAWWALAGDQGTIVNAGMSDVTSVLKAAGLDWETHKAPITNVMTHPTLTAPDGSPCTFKVSVPDKYMTYRERIDSEGNVSIVPLGVVGSAYTPVHNKGAFAFVDKLLDGQMIAETAGSFRDGRRVFISAELPESMIIDPEGVADEIRQFIMISNSHDGSTPVQVVVTPWRPVCENTERLAGQHAKTKWTVRHTRNAMDRMHEASRTLGLTNAYYREFKEESLELLQAKFSTDDVIKLIDAVWGEIKPDAETRTLNKRMRRTEDVIERFDREAQRLGWNAYAAERALTGSIDHFTDLRPRGALRGNKRAGLGLALLEESDALDVPKRRVRPALRTMTNR